VFCGYDVDGKTFHIAMLFFLAQIFGILFYLTLDVIRRLFLCGNLAFASAKVT
jgi:hypothetical protein